jgi:hypothetical protein
VCRLSISIRRRSLHRNQLDPLALHFYFYFYFFCPFT